MIQVKVKIQFILLIKHFSGRLNLQKPYPRLHWFLFCSNSLFGKRLILTFWKKIYIFVHTTQIIYWNISIITKKEQKHYFFISKYWLLLSLCSDIQWSRGLSAPVESVRVVHDHALQLHGRCSRESIVFIYVSLNKLVLTRIRIVRIKLIWFISFCRK